MKRNVENKVVVITGASSGIGETTAKHLASLGAKVVLGARRDGKLKEIVDEIIKNGGEATYYKTDVTKLSDVKGLIDKAMSVYGKVDVMINNAGLMAIAPLHELKTDEWEKMIDINIKGVLNGIAAVLPFFETQKSGHFINISSVAGIKVFAPGGVVYSGTKFAVRAITEGLRQEVGGFIRTTTIEPGAVESELKFGSTHKESKDTIIGFYKIAIDSESIARAIAYAIEQPSDVDVNEIVIRPTVQDF